MMTYVTAFIFYTLAMVGILLIGFVVYKKTTSNDKIPNKKMIKIIDSLPIGNKKMLHVVKVKNENFLIATNAEQTTFLSKLCLDNQQKKSFKDEREETPSQRSRRKGLDEVFNSNQIIDDEIKIDDIQRARAQRIQKQFKELYEKKELSQEALRRKEMMQKLLGNYKNGSKF